jgi:hypothetical protein
VRRNRCTPTLYLAQATLAPDGGGQQVGRSHQIDDGRWHRLLVRCCDGTTLVSYNPWGCSSCPLLPSCCAALTLRLCRSWLPVIAALRLRWAAVAWLRAARRAGGAAACSTTPQPHSLSGVTLARVCSWPVLAPWQQCLLVAAPPAKIRR